MWRFMKRAGVLTLCFILLASLLTGCGKDNSSSDKKDPKNEEKTQEELFFGTCWYLSGAGKNYDGEWESYGSYKKDGNDYGYFQFLPDGTWIFVGVNNEGKNTSGTWTSQDGDFVMTGKRREGDIQQIRVKTLSEEELVLEIIDDDWCIILEKQ